jgi:hypothetical protein
MRNALCMYGKVGGDRGKDGYGSTVDFHACFKTIKAHIIDINACDVFMHSWSQEHEDELVYLYQPKKCLIETQIRFKTTLPTQREKMREFICKSRWYSHQATLRLKREYEQENDFQYDWVMVCRYDLMFFVDFDFRTLEPGFLYASHFNEWRPGKDGRRPKTNKSLTEQKYLDMWFVGPSGFMDRFSGLYDHFYEYTLTNPHHASWAYVNSFAGDPSKATRFRFYRWHDYELYRIINGAKK